MEESYKKRLIAIGNEILSSSRNELFLSMRFLDIALNRLQPELYVSTLTIGTDGAKLLYNPNYLMKQYEMEPKRINRAYMHCLLHCLFRHMMLREEREEELWNLSCDIAVESMIDSMEYPALSYLVSDERNEVYESLREKLPVLSAEGIYREYKKQILPVEEYLRLSRIFTVDDHSMWENTKKEEEKQNQEESKENSPDPSSDNNNDQKNEKEQQLKKDWEEVSNQVATNLETFSRNIGEGAGDLRKQLKVRNRKQYNYREFLKKFAVMREEMTVDMDSFDYIYYTYGLTHYDNMPLIEPLEYKEEKKIEEFVIAIDTSGSCKGRLVEAFLQETVTILADSKTFAKEVKIYVIQCDETIQEVRELSTLEEVVEYMSTFEAKGFGGTDFRPVFTYVDSLLRNKELKHLKGIIYFTDGFGVFPKNAPSYETAFVFAGEEFSNVKVPQWAMKVVLSEEEIEKGKKR